MAADTLGGAGGAERGLANRLANGPGPLAGLKFQLVGPFQNVAKEELSALLKAAGAQLVARLPPSSCAQEDKAGLHVLVDVEAGKGQVGLLTGAAAQLGVPAVSHKWALACIGSFQVLPLEEYVVGGTAGQGRAAP